MNKLGHLTATGLLAQELPRRYRFLLQLGSLLPDLLVSTYEGGRYWDPASGRRQATAPQSIRPARSAQALMDCLTQTHREYARQTPGVGTDFMYLMSAAEQVLSYYAQVFQQNEAEFTLVFHPAEKLN